MVPRYDPSKQGASHCNFQLHQVSRLRLRWANKRFLLLLLARLTHCVWLMGFVHFYILYIYIYIIIYICIYIYIQYIYIYIHYPPVSSNVAGKIPRFLRWIVRTEAPVSRCSNQPARPNCPGPFWNQINGALWLQPTLRHSSGLSGAERSHGTRWCQVPVASSPCKAALHMVPPI